MASTNIDEIFSQIEKDFIDISKKAAKEAATKAQKDVREKADQFIDEYYAEYPGKNRKHALYKLIEEVYEVSEGAGGVTIEFGVKYNSSNIEGVHTSGSRFRKGGGRWIPRLSGDFNYDSKNNGIPEASWITEKFLSGIHPSGKIGDEGGATFTSPDEKMQKFFNQELDNKVSAYMNEALLRAVKTYF